MHVYKWVIFVIGSVFASNVFATECGFLACETAKAGQFYTACNGGGGHCECRARIAGLISLDYFNASGAYAGNLLNVGECNCTTRPDLGGGMLGTRANGKRCDAGCLFTPSAPSVKFSDANGQWWTQSDAGWHNDSGLQCNPLDNGSDESTPPPDPVECHGQTCVPADQEPPKFCIEHGGQRICVDPDQGPCAGDSSAGYLCMGNPPPDPPPPPESAPDPENPTEPAPPVAEGGPVESCNGAGACSSNNWSYSEGGSGSGGGGDDPGEDDPPEEEPPPPPGGLPGRCPDGSVPQQGMCPAPMECPGGVTPVNGQCPGNQSCAVGTVGANGLCSDGSPPSTTCANGATPNANGTCPASPSTCPNGAQPVNGQCSVVSECDPQTDPNQCQQDNGHASGGQTCLSPPACSGDQVLCMQVQQQWLTRCALDSLRVQGEPGESDYGPTLNGEDSWGQGEGGEGSSLDTGGWLGAGGGTGDTCPSLPTATFMEYTVDLASVIPCSVLHILATLILLGGMAQGLYIVGRGG